MTQAEILTLIDEELVTDNIKTELSEQKIVWTDHSGTENSVSPHQTAINNNGIIAWWQCNEAGKEEVRIRLKEKKIFTWKPPINTLGVPVFRDGLLYFYETHLIIKYKDAHYQRLFIFNIKTLKDEEILINALTIQVKIIRNELFLGGIYPDEEFIKITMHSDYFEKENIDEAYLRQRNITFD
ncbi:MULTISPECIES: hypothetical protein [unclassified Chryseobacterium]|uniref:hypothetical protein n=1 Tax=unclassified Chryseobacterium TaxID=2593645 RepID=UPI00100AC49D|nr:MULTISPECIES: hypothetical protein [unclassified Chryseobacterium]RXM52806.1 hypothetical protein BOQ64_08185 [Chryseobacterium sp. CH25]RXM66862.1 hypothetical protein BOQ60_02675 [Chryseobacterium sp. CH1]